MRAANTVNVTARSSNVADARFESTQGGFVTVNAGADPAATGSGKTAARLIGNVLGGGQRLGRRRLGQSSSPTPATSRTRGSRPPHRRGHRRRLVCDSHANPEVSVELGTSGSKVRTSSGISGKATSTYDSDATSKASAFGRSRSRCSTRPPTRTQGDRHRQRRLVLHGRRADRPVREPEQDRHRLFGRDFDAGDTCPLNGGSPGCIDRTRRRAATASRSRCRTGWQPVTSSTTTRTADGRHRGPDGGSYTVIRLDDDTVQLGAEFQGGSVNSATDTSRYARPQPRDRRPHPLLRVGHHRAHERRPVPRLRDRRPAHQAAGPGPTARGPRRSTARTSRGTTVTASNTFVNGKPVTYHAPAATATFTTMLVDAQLASELHGRAREDISVNGGTDKVINDPGQRQDLHRV